MREKQGAITTILCVSASFKASKERLVVSSVSITTGKVSKIDERNVLESVKCSQSSVSWNTVFLNLMSVFLPGLFPTRPTRRPTRQRTRANARLQSKRPPHDVTLACNRAERIPMGASVWSDRQRKVNRGKSSTACDTERLPRPSGTGIRGRGESGVMMSGGNWNAAVISGVEFFLCNFVAVKGRSEAKVAHFDLAPHTDGCSTCYRWQRQCGRVKYACKVILYIFLF